MQKQTGNEKSRGRLIESVGYVVSDKMDKTISVRIIRLVKHRKYNKYIRRSAVYKAHDEKNEAKMGDKVRIYETRPTSKTKRFRLLSVLERVNEPEVGKGN